MDDDTRLRHQDWSRKIRSYGVEDKVGLSDKLGLAGHLWNEYQYRHDLVWNLVFRLTTAVVVLAIIPYTQVAVIDRIGWWILAPPFLGGVLAAVGSIRVDRELRQLDHIRDLYRAIQDSLFYTYHGGKQSTFSKHVRIYLIVIALFAMFNIPLVIYLMASGKWWVE
jgi:hypothetical protein